eukprot:362879-Chlamydomonas_euryale.AAC.1
MLRAPALGRMCACHVVARPPAARKRFGDCSHSPPPAVQAAGGGIRPMQGPVAPSLPNKLRIRSSSPPQWTACNK